MRSADRRTEQEPRLDRSMDHSHASFDAYMKFLAGPSAGGASAVLETEHALSLHFDLLATQSFMSRRDPDRLVLGYADRLTKLLTDVRFARPERKRRVTRPPTCGHARRSIQAPHARAPRRHDIQGAGSRDETGSIGGASHAKAMPHRH